MVQSIAGICVCEGKQENRRTESRGRFEAGLKTEIHISALIAMVYAGLGDKASAFQWLETALRQRDDQLPALKVDPFPAPLRPDARFADLLRRVGLA